MVHRMIAPKPEGDAPSQAFDSERENLHRQMLSSVSHDLKTPLASIIGALEVYERMRSQLPVEKQTALITVALQEAYRLDSFITNILDMAKLDNGMVKSKGEMAEVGAMVRNCLLRIENRLRGSTVTVHKAPALEGQTDAVLLSRVICLVLDNAVKYGGTPPVINVTYGRNDDSSAFVTIQDNGGGVPEAQREAIFSKYTRSVKEDQQNAGTGLGLAISRSMMRLLGGTITAGNHPEGGALFTLHFPLQ